MSKDGTVTDEYLAALLWRMPVNSDIVGPFTSRLRLQGIVIMGERERRVKMPQSFGSQRCPFLIFGHVSCKNALLAALVARNVLPGKLSMLIHAFSPHEAIRSFLLWHLLSPSLASKEDV
jgi:hypothetical protein